MKHRIVLMCILLGAFAVRVYGIGFPRYHWDENLNMDSVLFAAYNRLALPTYVHGSFFQYTILAGWSAYFVLNGAVPTTQNLLLTFFQDTTLLIVARWFLVSIGTLTVAATYVLGKRLYNATVGLLAAFFLAFTFLHVSESHYARGHIFSVFWVTLAIYFCARILRRAQRRDYVLAGGCIGLATAAQYSAVLALIVLLVTHGLRVPTWRARVFHRSLLLGLDSAGIAFFLVTPYALLNFPFFAGEIKWFLTQVVSHTWVDPEGQPVWLFYLTEHLRNGMGLGLEIVALLGVIYALYRHRAEDGVLLAFPLPLFLTLAKGENFARYALPLLPFLAIAAARLLFDMVAWARARRVVLASVAMLLMVPSFQNIVRYDFWLTQPDTRAQAAMWMRANIPRDARIVIEGAGVLGPPVSPSRAMLDALIDPALKDFGSLYFWAMRENVPPDDGYRVETVFRLDERHEGGMLVGKVTSAREYATRGIEYLVTVSWMQRSAKDRYAPEFQQSLEATYTRVAEFRPTIVFRFDPYAWRMDYDALAQVVPGRAGVGGPILTVYRRRGE